MAAGLGAALAAHQLPPTITRITTTVAGRRGESMHHHFTFRPSSNGFAEERLVRGLHPRIAERMQLERLREFDLTRLSSVDEDVYLFRAVAKANKSDERLVALGQVRDLTPLRDDEGRIVALPAAEDVLATCLDAIRRARARPVAARAWPPTGSCCTRGRRSISARRTWTRSRSAWCRRPPAWTWKRSCSWRAAGTESGDADRHRRADRERRRLRRAVLVRAAADRADPAARRLPAERPARASRAARSTRTSWSRCSSATAGPSSSTTWSTAPWCRWTARAAATRPASSSVSSPRRPRRTPRA